MNARSKRPIRPPFIRIVKKRGIEMKLCSPGRRARLGVPVGGRVRMLRAVKGSLGHSPKERCRNRKVSMRAVKIAIFKIRRKAGSRYSSSVKPEVV